MIYNHCIEYDKFNILIIRMLYEDEYLLERIFDKLDGNTTKKFVITTPIVERKDRHTFVSNFGQVCASLGKEEEIIRQFIEKELGKSSSEVTVTAGSVLVITKSYQQSAIEKILGDYAKVFVICAQPKCGSGNTELIKENRILYLVCKKCNCKSAIATKNQIK